MRSLPALAKHMKYDQSIKLLEADFVDRELASASLL